MKANLVKDTNMVKVKWCIRQKIYTRVHGSLIKNVELELCIGLISQKRLVK